MALTERADGAAIRTHVEWLTSAGPRHPTNPSAVAASLAYLSQCLSGFGYQTWAHRYGPAAHEVNLLGELPNSGLLAGRLSGSILEIGGHWDTVPVSPGADDNATGVAGVLELARLFAVDPPSRPIRFCLFGGEEEQPPFAGSTAHVAGLSPTGPPVEGIIVLEMIGYRDSQPGSQQFPEAMVREYPDLSRFDRGDFIAAVGNPAAASYLSALREAAEAAATPLPMLTIPAPDGHTGPGARSDHYPYWRSGRKGVMLTDTAELRNPHYHRPTDLPATLDIAFAAQVTDTVANAVRYLSNAATG